MIEVEVEDQAWLALTAVEVQVERAALAALASAPAPGGSDVTVLLTDDEGLRDLNGRFRGRDAATNVLSFPAAASARPHLGDLALAYGVCSREAQAQAKTLEGHLAHLVVHGVLHLLGCDHQADSQAEVMEGMERVILAGLGIADPYGRDRADAGA